MSLSLLKGSDRSVLLRTRYLRRAPSTYRSVSGALDTPQLEELVGVVVEEMMIPEVYKFAPFGTGPVVANLKGYIIVYVK